MKGKVIITLICLFFANQARSQILDVPYLSDITGCGYWCWAKSAEMIARYYGNEASLCEILDYCRSIDSDPIKKPNYNTTDCCLEPDSCCSTGYLTVTDDAAFSIQAILNHYSIDSYKIAGSLTETQIQSELSSNRPFCASQLAKVWKDGRWQYFGHVFPVYGYSDGNLHIHNTGNGAALIDYDEFIVLGVDNVFWSSTLVMEDPATTCPLNQEIIGRLKISIEPFIYKATQDITIACIIESTADAEFYAGNDIIIELGFRSGLGSSFTLQSGATIICP